VSDSNLHHHASDGAALSVHVREEIDHWLAKFPAGAARP
jgi:hypothetical protein